MSAYVKNNNIIITNVYDITANPAFCKPQPRKVNKANIRKCGEVRTYSNLNTLIGWANAPIRLCESWAMTGVVFAPSGIPFPKQTLFNIIEIITAE